MWINRLLGTLLVLMLPTVALAQPDPNQPPPPPGPAPSEPAPPPEVMPAPLRGLSSLLVGRRYRRVTAAAFG